MGTRAQFGVLYVILSVATVSSTLPTKLRRECGELKRVTSVTREQLRRVIIQMQVSITKMPAAAHAK